MTGHRSLRGELRRKLRISPRTGWWLVSALALFGHTSEARVQSTSIIDTTVLHSQSAPAARSVPVRQPYFLGWSAEVSPPEGILKASREAGGLTLDTLGGSIYVGTREGRLVCLGPGGVVRWNVDLGGAVLAPPTVSGELVIVGTAEGVLHVLNKVTGARLARGILGEELITQPVVVEPTPGVRRAYVGSSSESLFAVDVDTGQRLWRAHRDAPSGFTVFGFSRPIVTERAVFVGYADGVVEARDPANGVTLWEKHLSSPADLQDINGLAFNGTTLFAASYSEGVYALAPEDGTIRWRAPLTGVTRLKTDGGLVYAGAPGVWTGLRIGDGSTSWTFKLSELTASTDPVISDRFLVFAEEGGSLYFIDKRTGEPAGTLFSGEGFSSPPAAAGPIVAVLSNGGRVYTLTVVP